MKLIGKGAFFNGKKISNLKLYISRPEKAGAAGAQKTNAAKIRGYTKIYPAVGGYLL